MCVIQEHVNLKAVPMFVFAPMVMEAVSVKHFYRPNSQMAMETATVMGTVMETEMEMETEK